VAANAQAFLELYKIQGVEYREKEIEKEKRKAIGV
jgi:hypothetical protein